MAMTLKEVSALLEEIEFAHQLEEQDEMIISGGGSKENRLAYFIMMRDEGKIFEMEGRVLDAEMDDQVKAKDHEHLPTLLPYLLKRNYETKFGTWEFNPENGVIRIMVEIPLEDNNLTKAQLERITNFMVSCSEEAGEIKHILATGKVPEKSDDEAMQMMMQLLEEMQKRVEEAKAREEEGI